MVGVALMVWGLWRQNGALAYLGGHYLLPTAIVLVLGWETVRAWRAREFWRLLPALGLLVAMGLGVMLLLDRTVDRYGTYLPQIVALHGLAAAFLFVLPEQKVMPAQVR